jgi:hypothetical protein
MDSCDIFGVRKQYIKDIMHMAKNGLLTLNILHDDIWKEEGLKLHRYRVYDERFLNNKGIYTHGRIFYDIKNDVYIIYTDDDNLSKENIRYHIILGEFDIPDNKTLIKIVK